MEKFIIRKKFKINFRSELCQKNRKKYELNIQELLKNSGVECILDLNKLIGKIKKHFIESSLDAEFHEHMGYQKHDQNSRDVSNNYRKGKYKKTISTDNGKIDIRVPRDELSTFEHKIVKKHEKNISRIEDQILFLYSKGISTRDIQETIYQMFYCDLDKDTISRITDKIILEARLTCEVQHSKRVCTSFILFVSVHQSKDNKY